MQEQEIEHIFSKISTVRLDTYKKHFSLENPKDIYTAYCWGESVSSSLFKIISTIEVVLRNSIHNSLQSALGKKWMIDENKVRLTDHQKDKMREILYVKKNGKITSSRVDPTPSENVIIAKLSFGFWAHFLDIKLLDGKTWDIYLPDIFDSYIYSGRYKGRQFWTNKSNIYYVKDVLRDINEIRNRIAHHEPIWKKSYLGYKPKNISDNLDNTVEMILGVLRWLSEGFYQQFLSSYHYEYLKYLINNTPKKDFSYHNGFTAVDIEIFKESISTDMSVIDKNHILLSGSERLGYFVKF